MSVSHNTDQKPQAVPAKLYKYQPFSEYPIDNLENGQVFFSRPTAFTDPFEFQVIFKEAVRDLTAPDAKRELFDSANRAAANFNESVGEFADFNPMRFANTLVGRYRQMQQEVLQNWGVACFTEVHDNPLMWSHYSDGHTGFCLEFSGDSPLFSKVWEVEYNPTVPVVDPLDSLDSEDALNRFRRTLIASKQDCWRYEKEWRCLSGRGDTPHTYDAEDLTGIYLGSRMSRDHEFVIESLLRNTPTKLFRMVGRIGSYELFAEPVKFDQPDSPPGRIEPIPRS